MAVVKPTTMYVTAESAKQVRKNLNLSPNTVVEQYLPYRQDRLPVWEVKIPNTTKSEEK